MRSGERFELLAGVRALALGCVVATHVLYILAGGRGASRLLLDRAGTVGVATFFAISGFVLYRQFLVARSAGERVALRRYAIRRLARVVPGYWLALTVLSLAFGLAGTFSGHFWVLYGFGQNYARSIYAEGLPPAWTLCVDVSFYAFVPVFAAVARRLSPGPASPLVDLMLIALLVTGSVAERALGAGSAVDGVLIRTLPGTFPWFAIGMALAVFDVCGGGIRRAVWVADRPVAVATAGALAFVALLLWPDVVADPDRPGWVVVRTTVLIAVFVTAALLLATASEHRRVVRTVLGTSVALWLGEISFGIYLWHDPFTKHLLTAPWVVNSPLPSETYVVSALGAAVLCATLAYYAVERPILRRVGSRGSTARSVDGPGGSTGLRRWAVSRAGTPRRSPSAARSR